MPGCSTARTIEEQDNVRLPPVEENIAPIAMPRDRDAKVYARGL